MQFDRNKLKEAILYACARCDAEDIGAVKLHKVLYFADMIRYAESGKPITGSVYVKRPHGPTNKHLLSILREMEAEGEIQISEADYHGYMKKEYRPLRQPRIDALSPAEQQVLDDVVDFVCLHHTARTISDYSHNRAWEMAQYGEEIPYRRAYLLYPSEVSEEAFEATAQGVRQVEATESGPASLAFVPFDTLRSRLQTRSL